MLSVFRAHFYTKLYEKGQSKHQLAREKNHGKPCYVTHVQLYIERKRIGIH